MSFALRLLVLWCSLTLLTSAGTLRIVSQTVGTDELLLALAEPEQVAALSHLSRESVYSAVAAQAAAYPKLERTADAEAILSHRPTLVLFADYSREELVRQVERTGTPILVFRQYKTLEDAYTNLRLLGAAMGPMATQRAEQLIAQCQERVTRLQIALQGATPVKVIAPSTYGVIPGADTTFADLCAYACAENLADTRGHLVGHAAPPVESMLTWPIQKVVVAGENSDSALEPFIKLPPYSFLPAVREKRVALIEPYQLSSVSHHRIEGYERLARELHPERFP